VIVRKDALEAMYPGGVARYKERVPNGTYCEDEYLTRVGFMHPDDVEQYLKELSAEGLTITNERGEFVDVAVIDNVGTGPIPATPWRPCPWLTYTAVFHPPIQGVSLDGTPRTGIALPAGWTPEQAAGLRWTLIEEFEAGFEAQTSLDGRIIELRRPDGSARYLGRAYPRSKGRAPLGQYRLPPSLADCLKQERCGRASGGRARSPS
jgi:hypothetical protein